MNKKICHHGMYEVACDVCQGFVTNVIMAGVILLALVVVCAIGMVMN